MKVVPEVLGTKELEEVKAYGFPTDALYSITFETEQEARDVQIILEKLLADHYNT